MTYVCRIERGEERCCGEGKRGVVGKGGRRSERLSIPRTEEGFAGTGGGEWHLIEVNVVLSHWGGSFAGQR